jgi:hypothetical protein
MAIVQTAIFDAINSFTNTYKNYHFAGLAPTGGSIEAAAASAAYRTLVNLYPTQIVYFDSALAASLAQIADGAAEDAGVAVGRTVALMGHLTQLLTSPVQLLVIGSPPLHPLVQHYSLTGDW